MQETRDDAPDEHEMGAPSAETKINFGIGVDELAPEEQIYKNVHTRPKTSDAAVLKAHREEQLSMSWEAVLPALCVDPNKGDDTTAAGTRARPFRATDAALEQHRLTREWKVYDDKESYGFLIQVRSRSGAA